MENSGNPWGMSQGERADWADKARGHRRSSTARRRRSTTSTSTGSAAPGRFDDKNKKVTQAMAKLLQRAGIDFAILGPSEMCTGDPARRSGNEYIFQMLAMQNIETLNGMGVKKIITQCPHCFNTLTNEYPQLGGHYEVVHHSQFLEWLIETGQARPQPTPGSTSGSSTTTPATSAATTTCTWRPARSSARSAASRSSRPAATAPRACAAAPAGPACGWRRRIGKQGERRALPGAASPPAPAASPPPARSATS